MKSTKVRPKCVGFWAVQVTPQMDLLKFGEDSDTIHPYKTAKAAMAELSFLKGVDPNSRYYILRLFSNGQMKTFDYE